MKVSDVTQATTSSTMCQIHQLCSKLQNAFDSALSSLQKNSERAKKRALAATQKLVTTNERGGKAQLTKVGFAFAQGLLPALYPNRSDLSQALYMCGDGASNSAVQYFTSGQPKDQAAQQAAEGAKRKITEAEQLVEQQKQRQNETTSRLEQQYASSVSINQ